MEQLAKLKDLSPPYFGTLAEWEAKATVPQRAAAVGIALPATDSVSLPRMAGHAGNAPMPYVGETKVRGGGVGGVERRERGR